MRQMEGGWLSNAAVERSKERIQRLPYVEKVDYETTPVPGVADQVDVDFNIKEGLPGQFGGGLGYSESQGIILNGNFVHSNFMGSGERIAAEINAGKYSKVYSISHTDPYRSIDGIARTISLAYRDVTQFVSASSDFSTKNMTAGLDYSYPITEYQALRFGMSASQNELVTTLTGSARQAVEWVVNNGDPFVHTEFDGFSDHRVLRHQVQGLRAGRRLELRHAQSSDLRRSRHAPCAVAFLCGSRQRRRILDRQLRLSAVPATARTLHAGADRGLRVWRGHRRHDFDTALPSVLCRRAGFGARLPGKPAGPERTVSAIRTVAI